MRNKIIFLGLCSFFLAQIVFAQCDFVVPPSVKKTKYADREFTFSEVTINGEETTYMAVEKGETIKMTTRVKSTKKGDYCPNCIVQVYWGINGHASECAKSFFGYEFNNKKTKLKFNAPTEDGIYFVTMGNSLEYSCKNNLNRPNCSPDFAIAVLKVGNPDPEQRIAFQSVKRGNRNFLKANILKEGCFGDLDKVEWFFEDKKLAYDDKEEIPLNKEGKYEVVYSNCKTSFSQSYNYSETGGQVGTVQEPEEEKRTMVIKLKPKAEEVVAEEPAGTIFEETVKNEDRFVLDNLIFDLGKSEVKAEAKSDLNELAAIMKNNPSMKILLEGHTDRRGSSRKNLILSEQRVDSVKEYLVSRGVRESNIDTKGWGDKKPLIITNDVQKGEINRRVEVSILSR
jgi:outer membrane protein OmpA-like peptidoglycan-associated protein